MRSIALRATTIVAATVLLAAAILAASWVRAEATASWRELPVVDVRTGAAFTLADLAGKTVFVEPMATWCTTCRRQMTILRDVVAERDPDDFAFVGLSVETNLPSEDLARYVDAQGFGWTFAVMTPELLRALVDTFGRSVANPPATPHVIIRPDGTWTELSTGIRSADEISAALDATASR
jgi:thiol-disulfide isomerase/thioredoxin